MKTLKEELSKFPEAIKEALEMNFCLLDKVDFDSGDADTYLEYLSKRIIFYDKKDGENGKIDISAFAYDDESVHFFENHLDSIFHHVPALFRERNANLGYVVQIIPKEIEEYYDRMRTLLSAYVKRLRSEDVARKAERMIEEKKLIGFDSIMRKNKYAQNNLLTKAGFSDNLSVTQKKMLNYFIFKFQFKAETDLFGESYVTVTPQELVKCGCGSNQTAIVKCLKELTEKTSMFIQFGGRWGIYNIFSSFTGEQDKKKITVRFTPEMTALINKIAISQNYTMISMKSINTIKRYATMRMYEFCNQFRNMDSQYVYVEDDVLRTMLNCKDKYENPRDFKRYVLKVAEKELADLAEKGKVDVYFSFSDVEKEKTDWKYDSKKITRWAFVIHKALSFEDGYISHDSMEEREQSALSTVENILNNCRDIDFEMKSVLRKQARKLSGKDLISMVQDLQLEVMFSSNKQTFSSVDNVFRKYGIRAVDI